ncbi:SPRY domain [Popillia japonica]|uniref:SPRY domain n=1 Tax=Popillia japonica TaxID=7064 RepID=A0AAW1M059_POPJA
MGGCWCKQKNEDADPYVPQSCNNHAADVPYFQSSPTIASTYYVENQEKGYVDSDTVDNLVLETLGVIGALVDNEQEPPPSMMRLHNIADNEEGWIQVVKSMVKVIPMSDPLGPSVITLLLDDCPLPSRESVLRVAQMFNLSSASAIAGRTNSPRERNICVVLGCIAEKLAGPSSLGILNEGTLDYLLTNLNTDTDPYVILFSLIALEKFAQTSENKATIIRRLEQEEPCPITTLERWKNEDHYVRRQVGFCAQWALDNLFVMNHRKYSFLTVEMAHINAMLNTSDVSEYLKISPDGLEARCDAYSFESVRCTAQADEGSWYYEVMIITPGVMQIGWATKNSNYLNHEGYGIGDDKFSLAYDGCRRLIWYNAKSEPQTLPSRLYFRLTERVYHHVRMCSQWQKLVFSPPPALCHSNSAASISERNRSNTPISAVLHLQQFRFAATREQGRHAEAHLPRAIAAAERPRGQLHVMLRPESVGETTTVRTFWILSLTGIDGKIPGFRGSNLSK